MEFLILGPEVESGPFVEIHFCYPKFLKPHDLVSPYSRSDAPAVEVDLQKLHLFLSTMATRSPK